MVRLRSIQRDIFPQIEGKLDVKAGDAEVTAGHGRAQEAGNTILFRRFCRVIAGIKMLLIPWPQDCLDRIHGRGIAMTLRWVLPLALTLAILPLGAVEAQFGGMPG